MGWIGRKINYGMDTHFRPAKPNLTVHGKHETFSRVKYQFCLSNLITKTIKMICDATCFMITVIYQIFFFKIQGSTCSSTILTNRTTKIILCKNVKTSINSLYFFFVFVFVYKKKMPNQDYRKKLKFFDFCSEK